MNRYHSNRNTRRPALAYRLSASAIAIALLAVTVAGPVEDRGAALDYERGL